jgi:hypothetical protein
MTNKGTGAGGSKTNFNGKRFEEYTNSEAYLLHDGFEKVCFNKSKKYYLRKIYNDKTIVFTLQNTFKLYVKSEFNINVFRCPDEAYIIKYNTGNVCIKILEKKNQNVEGSVEMKLWSGPSIKREYELVFDEKYEIIYAFTVNSFLESKLKSDNKKYVILNKILDENNILVLYGDSKDYFDTLFNWIIITSLVI